MLQNDMKLLKFHKPATHQLTQTSLGQHEKGSNGVSPSLWYHTMYIFVPKLLYILGDTLNVLMLYYYKYHAQELK